MNNIFQDLSFQTLFDASADAMILVNHTGHVVQANIVALNILEYSSEKICGLEVEKLMPESFREQHRLYRSGFNNQPEKRPMSNGRELIALKSNGDLIALNIGLSPIKTNQQTFILITFKIADRRRQAEDALRFSEERLRLAKESAGLGIFDFDLKHNSIHWNEKMSEIWGGKSTLTSTYDEFNSPIHPEDQEERNLALKNAINPALNGKYQCEYRVINPTSGIEYWVESIGKMHFVDGHPSRLIGVTKDVTAQKNLEKKIREQQLDLENLTKKQITSQTISAIAHEINQPLAAISAYSEVLMYEMDRIDPNPKIIKHALKNCVYQVHRAGKSLHDLMTLTQNGDFLSASFDLNEVVTTSINLVKVESYMKFNSVLELEKDMAHVLGNRTQVQKILINLLKNALEAMQSLERRSSAITIIVRTNKETNMAHVTFHDNGPGVNPEVAKHIFKPFFSTKPEGIGLGLVICRGLAELNGGQLWLDEASSTGTTIHFTLPFAP